TGDARDETRSHHREEGDDAASATEPATQAEELAVRDPVAETREQADARRAWRPSPAPSTHAPDASGPAHPPDRLACAGLRLARDAADRGQLRHRPSASSREQSRQPLLPRGGQDRVDRVVDRDDPREPPLVVDDWYGEQVVVGDDLRDLVLVGEDADRDRLPDHHLGD